jgi:hypothetical protein
VVRAPCQDCRAILVRRSGFLERGPSSPHSSATGSEQLQSSTAPIEMLGLAKHALGGSERAGMSRRAHPAPQRLRAPLPNLPRRKQHRSFVGCVAPGAASPHGPPAYAQRRVCIRGRCWNHRKPSGTERTARGSSIQASKTLCASNLSLPFSNPAWEGGCAYGGGVGPRLQEAPIRALEDFQRGCSGIPQILCPTVFTKAPRSKESIASFAAP